MAATPKLLVQPAHEVHEFSSTRQCVTAFSVMIGTVLEMLDIYRWFTADFDTSGLKNAESPHRLR